MKVFRVIWLLAFAVSSRWAAKLPFPSLNSGKPLKFPQPGQLSGLYETPAESFKTPGEAGSIGGIAPVPVKPSGLGVPPAEFATGPDTLHEFETSDTVHGSVETPKQADSVLSKPESETKIPSEIIPFPSVEFGPSDGAVSGPVEPSVLSEASSELVQPSIENESQAVKQPLVPSTLYETPSEPAEPSPQQEIPVKVISSSILPTGNLETPLHPSVEHGKPVVVDSGSDQPLGPHENLDDLVPSPDQLSTAHETPSGVISGAADDQLFTAHETPSGVVSGVAGDQLSTAHETPSGVVSGAVGDQLSTAHETPSGVVSGAVGDQLSTAHETPSGVVSGAVGDQHSTAHETPSSVVSGAVGDQLSTAHETPSIVVSGAVDDQLSTAHETPSSVVTGAAGDQLSTAHEAPSGVVSGAFGDQLSTAHETHSDVVSGAGGDQLSTAHETPSDVVSGADGGQLSTAHETQSGLVSGASGEEISTAHETPLDAVSGAAAEQISTGHVSPLDVVSGVVDSSGGLGTPIEQSPDIVQSPAGGSPDTIISGSDLSTLHETSAAGGAASGVPSGLYEAPPLPPQPSPSQEKSNHPIIFPETPLQPIPAPAEPSALYEEPKPSASAPSGLYEAPRKRGKALFLSSETRSELFPTQSVVYKVPAGANTPLVQPMKNMEYGLYWALDNESGAIPSLPETKAEDSHYTSDQYRVTLPEGRSQIATIYDYDDDVQGDVTY